LRGQVIEIAADGHLRGARQAGELGDRGRSRLLGGLGDQTVAFRGAHTVTQHHPLQTTTVFENGYIDQVDCSL
jgi:hypothetical protein